MIYIFNRPDRSVHVRCTDHRWSLGRSSLQTVTLHSVVSREELSVMTFHL